MKAKDVADFAFQRLQTLIEEKRIRPGTPDERAFLKNEIELGLNSLFRAHGVDFFPKIEIWWDPANPDELAVKYCENTNRLMSTLGLV